MKTTALNPNNFRKAHKKHSHQTCYLFWLSQSKCWEQNQWTLAQQVQTLTTQLWFVFTLLVELNVILDTIRVTKLSTRPV